MPIRLGSQPPRPSCGTRRSVRARVRQLVLGDDQTRRRGVILLARIARGHHRAGIVFASIARSTPSDRALHRRDTLVMAKITGSPLCYAPRPGPARRRTIPSPMPPRRAGGCARHSVGGFARDAIILRQIFSGLDHAADHPEAFDRLRHQPPAVSRSQHQIVYWHALANIDAVMFDVRHRFHPARDDDVGHAGRIIAALAIACAPIRSGGSS